jgi:GT2 family glycosyltransferase
MAPRISVVVPTHGRPGLLADCLEHVAAQDLRRGDYEVIVVDDGTPPPVNEANRAVVAAIGKRYPDLSLGYLWAVPNRGPATARNRGWRQARGEVIAFTDDDTRPASNWLTEGLRAMAGVEAVAGRVVVPVPEAPSDYERDAAGLASASFVTANAFVRREALASVGGFDERYRLAWREDSDLEFALRERGIAIGRAPRAVVVHPIRPARWGVSIRQQRKVVFDALLYKKHPRRYRSDIRPHPPWHYYLAVTALGVAAAAAWGGNVPLLAAALASWAGVTAWFCWTRLRGTRRTPGHVLEMLATSAVIPPVSLFWRLLGALRFRVAFF